MFEPNGLTNLIQRLFSEPWAFTAVKATLVLALAWFGARLLRRQNLNRCVFLLRFAAVAVLVLPVMALVTPSISIPILQNAETGIETALLETEEPQPSGANSAPDRQNARPFVPFEQSRMVDSSVAGAGTLSRTFGAPQRDLPLGIIVWVLGFASVLAYVAFRDLQIKRYLKRSTPAPDFARAELAEVCDCMGITSPVELRCLKEALTPFLYGIRRPAIVIPPRVLEEKYRGDLPAVLAHELSHVRSNDLAWKTAFRLMQALLWFHPFVWLLRRSHDAACEELSDARAALYVGDAQSYSQTLARVTLDLLTNPPVYAGLSMARLPEIRRRLETLKRNIGLNPVSRSLVLMSVAVGGLALAGLSGLQVVNAQSAAQNVAQNAAQNVVRNNAEFGDMQRGETWVYSHIGCRTGGVCIGLPMTGDRVRSIVGVTEENGEKRWMLREKWGDVDYEPLRAFLDERRRVHKMEEGAEILTYEPAVEWDWIGLQPGEAINVETIARGCQKSGLISLRAERLDDETLRVPAGTFENCLKIELVAGYTPPNQREAVSYGRYTAWYHPAANGLVKETAEFEFPTPNGPQTVSGTSMLKSHTIQ